MGKIHFQVSGGGGHVWLTMEIINDIAQKHGGELSEGGLTEEGKNFTIHADDDKIPIIQEELEKNKLPTGLAFTSDMLARMHT